MPVRRLEFSLMFTHKETKPVRLLHVIGDSRFGGAGRIILRLGQVARAQGWQVDILTTDPVFQRAVREHGLGLVNLDVIRREIHPLWDLGGLVRLSTFLRREGYGIVQTHTSKGGFVGRLAAWLAGVPVIVHTAHGFAFHERSPRQALLFYSNLERIASRWCDRIVSVSEFHRHWALDLGICNLAKILAIPNGIAFLTNPEIPRAELRRQLRVRNNDLLILTMARLAPDKGLEYLIEAAPMLLRSERQFQIVIAGDGPVRAQLEELTRKLGVEDWVTFLGFREDVSALLAASDLVVLPSLREGLSISLLEAMAAGKPIIATSIGSHREVASQSEIALVVPPADSSALCGAILQLAQDPLQMVRLGKNARALFESQYTEERMLNTYKQLYVELLREKCPADASVSVHRSTSSAVPAG